MCVIFLAYRVHPEYPLILLANRDEFYDRPTRPAHQWGEAPDVYGGRDLLHGGTWLGITNAGRFAAVTNYRDPAAPRGRLSRGNLVGDFLKSRDSAAEYFEKIRPAADQYSGFNLLVGEVNRSNEEIAYFSNRSSDLKFLAPGIYGLSNHLLDTPWRKIEKGKTALRHLLEAEDLCADKLFDLLLDRTLAADDDLPETGIGRDLERLFSSIFIETDVYGTRCSSVVLFNGSGKISFDERVHR